MTDMKHIILLITAFLLTSTAMAQPYGRYGGDMDGFRGDGTKFRLEMKEKLNLTEQQETQLKAIRTSSGKVMIDLRADLQKKRLDVRAMLDSDNADDTKLEQIFREQADLQVEMKMAMFEADQKVISILNPEQQKIWKEIKQYRRGLRHNKGMRGSRQYGGRGQSFGGRGQSFGGRGQSFGGRGQSFGGRGQSFGGRGYRDCDGSGMFR